MDVALREVHTRQRWSTLERELTELTLCGPSDTLKVLTVGSETLHRHVCALVHSVEDAVSVAGHDAAMSRLAQDPFDVVLLEVGESVLNVMVAAAGMRAIERRHRSLRHAAIIACTTTQSHYADCACAGSGLSDALNVPWTVETVHACLDRWRAGKYLRELALVQDTDMPNPAYQPTPPLQEAVLAWAAAVETVEQEALRIIRGGPVDRPRVAELLAAVEAARVRCEQQAASLFSGVEERAL